MPDAIKKSFTDAEALEFHRAPTPGKISITPTKPMATQRDLSLAYSPGVAVPVKAIAEDPDRAYDYTSKGNLVAVVSNGTAILGLGNLGAMASKPVMEGKSVLFKRFADVDSMDIEVTTQDVEEFIITVRNIGQTFEGWRDVILSADDMTGRATILFDQGRAVFRVGIREERRYSAHVRVGGDVFDLPGRLIHSLENEREYKDRANDDQKPNSNKDRPASRSFFSSHA